MGKNKPSKLAALVKKQKANGTRRAARARQAKPRHTAKLKKASRSNARPTQRKREKTNLRMANPLNSQDIIELAKAIASTIAKPEIPVTNNQADGRRSRVARISEVTLAFTVVGVMVALLSLEIQTNQSTRKVAEDLLALQKQFLESKSANPSGVTVQLPRGEWQSQRNGPRKLRRRKVMPVIKSEPNPAVPTEEKP